MGTMGARAPRIRPARWRLKGSRAANLEMLRADDFDSDWLPFEKPTKHGPMGPFPDLHPHVGSQLRVKVDVVVRPERLELPHVQSDPLLRRGPAPYGARGSVALAATELRRGDHL